MSHAQIQHALDWGADGLMIPHVDTPDVARRATPGGIENGELVVQVRGSVWYAELRRTAPRLLLPKVRAFLGGDPAQSVVRAIRVVPAR